jgi:hypothetical protein
MRIALMILSLLLIPVMTSTAVAQEETSVLKEADYVLTGYTPLNVDAVALLRTVDSLYGRKLEFYDRKVDNLALLNNDLVIYETEARTKLIIAAIKQLDRAVEPPGIVEQVVGAKEITSDDMEMSSFSPKHFALSDFYSMAMDFYGRDILVGDNWHQNLRMLINNNKIMIYEEKAEMPLLMERLHALDNSQASEENEEGNLVTMEYKPRHVSARGLMKGLQAFQAGVKDSRMHGRQMNSNIMLVDESGLIVIRDFPSHTAEILSALERMDQPVPQIMLTCYVVHGIHEGQSAKGKPAPQDLQGQLKQVLPFDHFELTALGLMRASALAGTELALDMDNAAQTGSAFRLRMEVGAFDNATGALSLDECRFSINTQQTGNRELFSTATTIYKGEYAVLGVTGTDPIFLVVQVHPIQAK